jgi:tRNA threonylcarbamoyladenosine biosynthesis protein TsaE
LTEFINMMNKTNGTEIWESHSEKETMECGQALAKSVRPGTVIGLLGDLGSGKTTFVKGIARGLGVQDEREVKSPTFVIFHMYDSKPPLYHFDFYRLNQQTDLTEIGMDDYILGGNAVSVIEWANRIPSIPFDLEVTFTVKGESDRSIQVVNHQNEK